MKAITYERYGGPDVLSLTEVDPPECGDDEILIRVQAVEATKTDCELRSFRQSIKWFWLPLRLAVGVFRPRRTVLGMYFAGVVESVGDRVDGYSPGDAVFGSTGMRCGAYAEYAVVSARAPIAKKPTSMTFAEAAAVPLGAINALHFMRLADVRDGERVLVNGAGGVIGAYGVQVARSMGAAVTGVDAAHKEAFVRSMGATEFHDYRVHDVTELGERFDVVFDMVPSTNVSGMLRLLAPGGRYVNGNPRLLTMLRAPLASRRSDRRLLVRFADESPAILRELATMIDRGELGSIVDRVLPLEEVVEAHRLVETEQRTGAIVLAVGDLAGDR